jgi:branched-chain amino acid transport system substrate-binding protein
MRKVIITCALGAGIAALFFAWVGSGAANVTSSKQSKTLVIGFDSSLTGDLNSYDPPVLQGLQYGIAQVNAAGGIDGTKIVLKTLDNRSDIATSVTVARQLISDGADFMITTCDPAPTLAAGPIAAAAHIPVMSACAGEQSLTTAVGPYLFMAPLVTDNEEGAVEAQYAWSQGYKTAYLLQSPISAYTEKGPHYFAEAFQALGGKIVGTDSYTAGAATFSPQVTRLKNFKPVPSVIETFAYIPDSPTLFKQIREAGIKTPIIGSDGDDASELITGAGSAANGVVFTTHYYPSPGSKTAALFKALQAKYGSQLSAPVFSTIGYNIIEILKAAVLKAKSTNGAALRTAINSLSSVPGATVPISYASGTRIPRMPASIVKVENGKFVLLKQVIPTHVPST